jgi:hypothetical protein
MQKVPGLFLGNESIGKVKLSAEFLNKIFKILAAFDQEYTISIQTAKDYPATFENDHIKIILAPKVDND